MIIKAHKSEVEWGFIDKGKLRDFCMMVFPPNLPTYERRIEIICENEDEYLTVDELYREDIEKQIKDSEVLTKPTTWGLNLGKVFYKEFMIPGLGVVSVRRENK